MLQKILQAEKKQINNTMPNQERLLPSFKRLNLFWKGIHIIFLFLLGRKNYLSWEPSKFIQKSSLLAFDSSIEIIPSNATLEKDMLACLLPKRRKEQEQFSSVNLVLPWQTEKFLWSIPIQNASNKWSRTHTNTTNKGRLIQLIYCIKNINT